MTEVLVAVVGALGLLLVAAVNVRLNGRVKAVQRQVENDHTSNLRDELDDRHGEIYAQLQTIREEGLLTRRILVRLIEKVDALEGNER